MRGTIIALLATVSFTTGAAAADAPAAETLLAGSRWMEIGVFDRIENIAPEKMVVLRLCAIADIAFVIEEGKLTRYDRAGLSGNGGGPAIYVKVETEPAPDGATLVTLHLALDSSDTPDRYRIDVGGEIMRVRVNGASGSAYMKCRMRS